MTCRQTLFASAASIRVAGARQAGLTIIELMISLALGLLVVLAASSMVVAAKASYVMEDEAVRLNDTARLVSDLVTRAVRQSAYRNQDPDDGPVFADALAGAGIGGLDATSLKSDADGMDSLAAAVNGSDVLAVRFFGVGTGDGDGSMLNCAGFSVGAPAPPVPGLDQRGWSIFYVAKDTAGEPELRCKYPGKSGWTSDAIARGVESFQVLYGLDLDGDGLANRYLNAASIEAMDSASALAAAKAAGTPIAPAPATASGWTNVVEVRIAMLMRGGQDMRPETSANRFELFDAAYGDASAGSDPGTVIELNKLPAATRNRMRKIFRFSIQLARAMGKTAA